ncbi:MAG: DUF6134 family protein [Gammaproteobacteria bacterium]|nr:DUF6134 family protein [Gammaproteobacteria bacterium]
MNIKKTIFNVLAVSLSIISFSSYAILKNDLTGSKKNWQFIAYLDNSKIGYHNFEVNISDSKITVKTQAVFDVTFMFIPVFKYEHSNFEVWNNGCLVKLNSTTNNDGEDLFVNLLNSDGFTYIQTPGKKLSKPDCVRSFAYWDEELIKSKVLMNTQSGELLDVTHTLVGTEKILINDNLIDTKRYQLQGKDEKGIDIDISLWYNKNNHWVALESRLENGRILRYQLK